MIRLRAWLAILVTAVGLYLIGRWQGFASAAENQAVSNAQTALDAGPAHRAHQAARKAFEQKQLQVALIWKRRADSLRALALHEPIHDTVQFAPDSSLKATWREVADAEHKSASACFLSLQTCGQRADTAEARVAVLDSLLRGVLQVHQCHVLFIACPSRFATGVVTGGLGIIMGLWLRHP